MKKILNNLKMGTKVISNVLLLVVLAVVAEMIVSNVQFSNTIERQTKQELQTVAETHDFLINQKLDEVDKTITSLAVNSSIVEFLALNGEKLEMQMQGDTLPVEVKVPMEIPEAFSSIELSSSIVNAFLISTENKILAQKGAEDDAFFSKEFKIKKTKERYTSEIIGVGENAFVYTCIPVEVDEKGGNKGHVVIQSNIKTILESLPQDIGLRETGEVLYAYEKKEVDPKTKKVDTELAYINKARNKGEVTRISKVDIKNHPVSQVLLQNKSGYGEFKDYSLKENIGFWRPLERIKVAQVVKIKSSEVYQGLSSVYIFSIVAAVVILALALFTSILFSKLLIGPMVRLKDALNIISKGILPKPIKPEWNDEIGEMTETVNDLVGSLKRTAEFAHQIGKGNFDTNFKPLSDKDTLGMSLVNMKESLQEADTKDNLRNWIVTGVAEIGEILRNNDKLESLGDEILKYLCARINAVQGAFYTLNDDDENNTFIEMKSSYAYERKKYVKAEFKFAEGLVGQVAAEKDKVLRTEIPEDYVNITSGLLGEQKPTCILLVPLITNEKVYGVLEFAALHKLKEGEIEFVEEVSDIIARTVFNIKVNEQTRNLLEASQRMSSELQEQQKVLQQNAIEMEETQEKLKRSNIELEHQMEEVNRAQKRMQVLLENASEVITIYDKNLVVKYVSPSILPILGYGFDELVGTSDVTNIDEGHQEEFKEMFQQLMEDPDKQSSIQFMYKKKNGEEIWLEAIGNNMLGDPAIEGIVINSQDITERRRAEEEERKRGQMQALSENSPDLITRIDDEGNFFYINPAIKALTGFETEHFINKAIEDVGLNEEVVTSWKSIIDQVFTTQDKYAVEMDFPTEDEDRIMQVNAIPEYDTQDNIESVLVVSHDITVQKSIENQVRDKNKKINDSINYAERIQDAILPNTEVIKRDLPESFIYFLPRDVVSGDFPWYMKKGDDIFISAVDCTGHGVPGALISIIGYFLLHDVVVAQGIEEPGKVLDSLDASVVKTLRQDDENSKLKDGMDIGFCRINTKDNIVEYAGAHRPLYLVRDGELIEFKGNKFPIGGGSSYKNKTNFTNHRIEVKKGDAIYFFSDGYPDQFGGPNDRKFGPKRIKQMITEKEYVNFDEMYTEVSTQFDNWKEGTKQTDDVLLIGIKF